MAQKTKKFSNSDDFGQKKNTLAPRFPALPDRRLIGSLRMPGGPETLARTTGLSCAEVVLRLVELQVGALGCVRPIRVSAQVLSAGQPEIRIAGPGADRQPPIVNIAAGVFGSALQRLGDRLFLSGEEVPLPELVRRARKLGVRIRYPGIDPMEAAMEGGPSRRRTGPSQKQKEIWEIGL